jgi:hypothetical protein
MASRQPYKINNEEIDMNQHIFPAHLYRRGRSVSSRHTRK